ncbi:hypothetical protein [Halorussus sp. MSC15.2]|uniref:hypothetical protein n=1 Tax=Halorussus sp. MSC15.2 TaxID=2283638 RepID=UPI0013D4CF99|nr:hypothetical protein [Halorussus sp. MSC15.2]NEU56186.1 hypothetical protein [Halorussus sp. MSC15.2]
MVTEDSSRRAVLSGVAATGLAGLAGCLGGGGVEYTLSTNPAGESLRELARQYLQTDPTAERAKFAVDYPDEYKHSVVRTLLEEGSVEVLQWQLAYDRQFGTTTRPRPYFLRDDGTYYSVVADGQSKLTATRWVFYLDPVESEPSDSATVVTEPPSSLSETDTTVVRRALEIVTSDSGPRDRSDYPLGKRGPIFHDQMDPSASDLVPSPPFDYVERDGDYYAAVAQKGAVELTRYSFTAREVATSMAELERFVERETVDARFDGTDLPSGVTEILRTATDVGNGRLYRETGPMSDGLRTILERLGMLDHMPENVESESVRFAGATFRYDGTWYHGSFWTR